MSCVIPGNIHYKCFWINILINVLAEKEETPIIGDDNPLSEYEQQRLSRIEENNKTLLKLVSLHRF